MVSFQIPGGKNVQFWSCFFCNKEKELDSLEPWYLCIWWFIQNLNSNVFFPQFVPFRDYIDRTGNHILSMARLAKDVLAEIPDQFLSYMRTRGIKPSPAPPPYTPPGQPLQTQIWRVKMWKIWTWGLKSTCRILSLPYAALHALPSWITVAILVFRKVCVGQESATFQHRKSQWKSVYFHCQAFLLVSGFFLCLISRCPENLETMWGVQIKLRHKGSPDAKKNKGDEGPFLHWRKNVSRQNKGSLILSWPFCK